METILETVDADVETSQEILFKVTIEGLDQAPSKVRLVCEDGDVGYVFTGKTTDQEGIVSFVIPPNKLKEATYLTKVEVLVENRYFNPVSFYLAAKKAVKVMAEAVKPAAPKPTEVKVSAAPVVKAAAPKPVPVPIVEAKKEVVKATPTLKDRRKARIDELKATDAEMIRELARGLASLRVKK